MPTNRSHYSTELTLWILFFCFATSAALLFQKLLLPLVPSLHAGSGLLDGDSTYFHSVAVEVADRIRRLGWSEWSFYPGPGATGNVAILSALYALFGNDPSLIVPINAAVHALGGVLIYRIGCALAPGRTGAGAGIVSAVLFVMFPSALNWYGQVHKDGFVITGMLLAIWSWLWLRGRAADRRGALVVVASTLAAALLIAFVRPYNLILLTAAMSAVFCVALVAAARRLQAERRHLAVYLVSLAILAGSTGWPKFHDVEEQYGLTTTVVGWNWERTHWLPYWADGKLEMTARTRARFIGSGIEERAGSMIDVEDKPNSAIKLLAYAPRAIQIALFAPFPAQWLEKISPARLVSVLETLTWYLIAPGALIAVYRLWSARILMAMCFALSFLYVYGLAIPNVGTLYRVRYPYLFLFITLGVIGWLHVLDRWWPAPDTRRNVPGPDTGAALLSDPARGPSRSALFGAGIAVAALTGAAYVGLFLRDIILARWFGLGPELDAYFLATAIPMFLVAVMSIPLGTMMVPLFLSVREQASAAAAQRLISRVSAAYLLVATAAAASLFLGITPLLETVGWSGAPDKVALARELLIWMLPILVLSGLVVLGNALLNALGYYLVPAMAQLAVPVLSILALVLFGAPYGIAAAIAGMLAGQGVNLWLVSNALRKLGYSVRPALHGPCAEWNSAVRQYVPLATAALLVNLTAPVNLGMASTLTEGSTAALGLGNKIVFFVTGLVAAGVATVILPHFSAFMARRRLLDARNELALFLLAGTVITIPFAIVAFVGSEALVKLAFQGGAFGESDVGSVARIMSYGIIQLPFFTINLLILKFAVATRSAGRVLVASLLALCLNIALNAVLMDKHGATGIALAATIACALSAGCMLLLFQRLGHVSWVDLVTIGLTWMPYITFIVCLQYQSYAGVVVSTLALVMLLYGHWGRLVRWRGAAPGG